MRSVTIVMSTLAILSFSGCGRDFSPLESQTNPPARPLTLAEQNLAGSSNTFGWSLLNSVARQDGSRNTFISPLSVTMALAMAGNGAAGETETALRSTLGFGDLSRDEVNRALAGLGSLLTSLDHQVKFQIANSIWYRQSLSVDPGFITTNKTWYNATVKALDFSSPQAANAINTWARENTNGRIPKVIDRIDPEIVMMLLNAIYFKASWTTEFDKADTRDDLFYPAEGRQSACRMMRLQSDMSYYENDLVQMVDLPYGNGQFAMTILLPRTNIGELTSRIDQNTWEEWLRALHKQPGTLFLPKFKLSYEVMLNDALKSMGMAVAFDPELADFSGISRDGDLFISYVKHNSFVQVDEEGTEAAAVTTIGIGTTSVGGSGGFVMRVDRPFLAVIHDHHTQTALFIGRIFDPAWN